jgi:hypothetical protein
MKSKFEVKFEMKLKRKILGQNPRKKENQFWNRTGLELRSDFWYRTKFIQRFEIK